jgi:hypothetical protein
MEIWLRTAQNLGRITRGDGLTTPRASFWNPRITITNRIPDRLLRARIHTRELLIAVMGELSNTDVDASPWLGNNDNFGWDESGSEELMHIVPGLGPSAADSVSAYTEEVVRVAEEVMKRLESARPPRDV